MSIKTTRLKNIQLPRTATIDLSNQMNGTTQTFTLGRRVSKQDTHYLIWNSTVYRNSKAREWYRIAESGVLTTFFDKAPVGGSEHTLLLVISDYNGQSPVVTKEELDQTIAETVGYIDSLVATEKSDRESMDRGLKDAIISEQSERREKDEDLQSQIDAIVNATDVKDVVGTKAELDAYDTSELGDRDIIKVLSDESNDGATTYYRFDKASGKFNPIGAVGPYYTKAEVDAIIPEEMTVSEFEQLWGEN